MKKMELFHCYVLYHIMSFIPLTCQVTMVLKIDSAWKLFA